MSIHTPIKADTVRWQDNPAVRVYLDHLDIEELFLHRPLVVMGDDQLHYTGDPVECLRDMREALIAEAFGCTFREAEERGMRAAYLALHASAASVEDVLSERFGRPGQYGPADAATATRMMRAAYMAGFGAGVAA